VLCGAVAGALAEWFFAVANNFARLGIGHHLFIFILLSVDSPFFLHSFSRFPVEIVASEALDIWLLCAGMLRFI